MGTPTPVEHKLVRMSENQGLCPKHHDTNCVSTLKVKSKGIH